MMDSQSLDFLEDRFRFNAILSKIEAMDDLEKANLLQRLESRLVVSSSWVTSVLFKPGIRNLLLQEKLGERLGTTNQIKQMEQFLGDQDYQFKFFFQRAISHGTIPTVIDLLKQAINLPRFRFREEAIDLLAELAGVEAVPFLFNLVSGLDPRRDRIACIVTRIEGVLDILAEHVDAEPRFGDTFKRLRLALATLDLSGQVSTSTFEMDD
jgi:hypothetical protein